MDTLLTSVLSRRNVAVLSMQGLERSRFFLRFSLNLIARNTWQAKIYHVLDNDRLVTRVQKEAASMPFDQFEAVGVSLIICTTTYLHQHMPELQITEPITESIAEILIIYDVASLESLEGSIIELQPRKHARGDLLLYDITKQYKVTSTILACNGPLDGIESDLGIRFTNIINYNCLQDQQKGTASYIEESGLLMGNANGNMVLDDRDLDDRSKPHHKIGGMLERLASSPSSGRVVVFFPTYGKMVEFHNAWKQSGVFDRIGLPYARENRGGDHFKNALKDLAARDRSIFLCSIRYHQDEDLAEMVLGQVETFVIVGLPYPIMSDTWTARIAKHDELSKPKEDLLEDPITIRGSEFYKCRAIDFMNGIIKRCLFNGYRSKPCHFLILGVDRMREVYRHKLVKELGDVQVWPQTYQ